MSISVRIFEFRMGIGIEKSDKFQFVNQYVALGRCLRDGVPLEQQSYETEGLCLPSEAN